MTNFEDLKDWLAICEVKARYCRLMDTKDWDGFRELFTDDLQLDATDDSGLPPTTGRDAVIDQMILRYIEHAVTVHQVHSPEIELKGEEAQVIWAMQDRVIFGPEGRTMTGYGHYHERYIREGGQWKIAAIKLTRLHIDEHQPVVSE